MAGRKPKSQLLSPRVTGETNRTLRQKTPTRGYVDLRESDSEDESRQGFNLQEKLMSTKFPKYREYFIKELLGEEVDLAYFQRSGFCTPMLVRQKDGLGMKMPDSTFTVSDVRQYVGARRVVDVMDCATQRNTVMTMKDFEEYYNNEDRNKQLNVISLEFSCTNLDSLVEAPKVVRQIDWTDNVWPRHLKNDQLEGTNDIRHMKYPKVQKYCLMSVRGCYTDFHIDFGGSSVWYHIIRGKKVFWLVPPTENNLKSYEMWTLSGHQQEVFFGDLAEKCGRIELEAGSTFFIPSGWIHAVYTPEDSLVFGGNFLHSFAIDMQIRVAQIEESTKVPAKFRFPFFTELQWYALDRYTHALRGRTHMEFGPSVLEDLLGDEKTRQAFEKDCSTKAISQRECFGLQAIIMYVHALPVSKKVIPEPFAKTAIELIRDIRNIVSEFKTETEEDSITGRQLLYWPGYNSTDGELLPKKRQNLKRMMRNREKRVSCRICQSCVAPDCRNCDSCRDMVRYGGPGLLKIPCQTRKCIQPLLPISVCCFICGLDGWFAETFVRLAERPPGTCALMECFFCYEITHPTCVTDYGVEGVIRMDMPNSWECPRCIKTGAVKSEIEDYDDPTCAKIPKTEPVFSPSMTDQFGNQTSNRIPIASGADTDFKGYQLFSVKEKSNAPKQVLRLSLADQILAASTKDLKKPQVVVRPPPLKEEAKDIYEKRLRNPDLNLSLEPLIMLPVLKKLRTVDRSKCAIVCKKWNRMLQDPTFWTEMSLEGSRITGHVLSLIVQRQPVNLNLSWSSMNKTHMAWLLPRIPQTRTLSLAGLDVGCVNTLTSCSTPMLSELDLSLVSLLNDSVMYKILTPVKDTRPGLSDKKSRLKLLSKLNLSGTDITDVSLRYIAQYLPQITTLSLSGCWRITDAGIAQLSVPDARTTETLVKLDLSSCVSLTNQALQHLTKCVSLSDLDCKNTQISEDGLRKFVESRSEPHKYANGIVSKRA